MVKTTILLTEDQHSFLRKLSYENGKSIGEIVRGYIDQFSTLVTSMGPIPKESRKSNPITGVTSPQGKLLSKVKARIPLSKEMEEKIGLVGKRGELDADNYV